MLAIINYGLYSLTFGTYPGVLPKTNKTWLIFNVAIQYDCMHGGRMITLQLTRDESEWLQLVLETSAESANAYGEGDVEQMADRLAEEIGRQLD